MTPEFVAVVFAASIAAIVVSAAAYSFGLRWLDDRAKTRVQENVLAEATARLDQTDQVISKLAVDWRAKFLELETDWKKLKEHADSQYAGAVAQIPAVRGFNR